MPTTTLSSRNVVIPAVDGLSLHARHWSRPDSRGVVVVAHGFGEHGGWYEHVAEAVGRAAGVDFVVPDLRGHGLSEGKRGVVGHYDDLTADLASAFDWAGRERPGLPRFVLGHSNGGQVALRAGLDPELGPRIAGMIVSNPSIELAVRVPGYKLKLGRFLLRHAPRLTLPAGLRVENLTRDPAMQKRRRNDRLDHSRISAPLFFGMIEGGRMISERASEFTLPLLMILGGSDPIIDPSASRDVFDRFGSADKTLMLYPGMLHEPFNELGREQVLADVSAWLDTHLPPSPSV